MILSRINVIMKGFQEVVNKEALLAKLEVFYQLHTPLTIKIGLYP